MATNKTARGRPRRIASAPCRWKRYARVSHRGRKREAGIGPHPQEAARQRVHFCVLPGKPQLPRLSLQRTSQSPPAEPQRQHQKAPSMIAMKSVAGRGDERRNQTKPRIGRLHASDMDRKQHNAGNEQPIHFHLATRQERSQSGVRLSCRTAHARPNPASDPGVILVAPGVPMSSCERGETSIRQPAAPYTRRPRHQWRCRRQSSATAPSR